MKELDLYQEAIEELIRIAGKCNAGKGEFSYVRPDGWKVSLSVENPTYRKGDEK